MYVIVCILATQSYITLSFIGNLLSSHSLSLSLSLTHTHHPPPPPPPPSLSPSLFLSFSPSMPPPPPPPPPTHTPAHFSRFHTLMCGDEWVFFNAAQVLPCYVIKVYYKSTSKSDWQPVNPPSIATKLLQEQTDKDEGVPKVERDRQRKAKLLARVSMLVITSDSVCIGRGEDGGRGKGWRE